jgi:hypothetical protein
LDTFLCVVILNPVGRIGVLANSRIVKNVGNVRWATDRWAVAFSASEARRKQWGGTHIGKTKTPYDN